MGQNSGVGIINLTLKLAEQRVSNKRYVSNILVWAFDFYATVPWTGSVPRAAYTGVMGKRTLLWASVSIVHVNDFYQGIIFKIPSMTFFS